MRDRSFVERSAAALGRLQELAPWSIKGEVACLSGLSAEITGLNYQTGIGDRLHLHARSGQEIEAEIVAFRNDTARAMTLGNLDGIGPGATAIVPIPVKGLQVASLAPADTWLGRVINPLGKPLDGKGPILAGSQRRAIRAGPPPPVSRAKLGPRLDLGIRSLNCFTPCRIGQRMGLFAGSGIGKSTLLGMIARGAAFDVAVVALVGERGREVREFLDDQLGPEGLARSVVVVATSDAPPLLRREAAYAAMTVAEHFRDQSKSVLLLMDSVTRYCLALREIGLSIGEPPATRGYPPSVFAELPRLLERAGPGLEGSGGAITAIFTVLVEGDDQNEPVADAVRGILDGHIVLDRRIAETGRYPAVDVLRSLSRAAQGCATPEQEALVGWTRRVMAVMADMADMVRLGAYRPGSDPGVDEAIALAPRIEAVLSQRQDEHCDFEACFDALHAALRGDAG